MHLKEILYLYTKLYSINLMVVKAVKNELANDKNMLKSRINSKIRKNHVHMEIYSKLLKKAKYLYAVGRLHLQRFRHNRSETHRHLIHSGLYEHRVNTILDTLKRKDFKKFVHKMLLFKTIHVFKSLLEASERLTKKILEDIKVLSNFSKSRSKVLDHEINYLIEKQIRTINDFAINYSYSILHSEEFLSHKGHKVLLITRQIT